MAFETSFRLFDDSALVVTSASSWAVDDKTDHSEGAIDRQYWFGSNGTNVKLQTTINPGTDNITLTPTYILPTWAASTAYTLGASIIPTAPNGYRYVVTTAGTSGSTEPTWGVTLNGNTTDGTAVWTLVAAQSNITEIKLALTEAGLATATGGASLSLGNTALCNVSNATTFWIRDTNAVATVSSTVGQPEYGLYINACTESPQ